MVNTVIIRVDFQMCVKCKNLLCRCSLAYSALSFDLYNEGKLPSLSSLGYIGLWFCLALLSFFCISYSRLDKVKCALCLYWWFSAQPCTNVKLKTYKTHTHIACIFWQIILFLSPKHCSTWFHLKWEELRIVYATSTTSKPCMLPTHLYPASSITFILFRASAWIPTWHCLSFLRKLDFWEKRHLWRLTFG